MSVGSGTAARIAVQASKEGYQLSQEGPAAADWLIVVTSLDAAAFSAKDALDLHQLRYRIQFDFERVKSLVGLDGPPGADAATARAYVLAHVLMMSLLKPPVDAFEDSPHWAYAA